MSDFNKTFKLSAENIDEISSSLEIFLNGKNVERKSLIKLKFSIEDVLLHWSRDFGEDTEATVTYKKFLGQSSIHVSAAGFESNPFKAEDDVGMWMNAIVSRLQNIPVHSYSKGINTAIFKLEKKTINPFLILLCSIVAALAVGLIGSFLSPQLRTAIASNWLNPLCTTYANVLGFFGIPLMFLSICLGIVGVGDIHTFSVMGTKIIRLFMQLLIVTVIGAFCLAFPFFKLNFSLTTVIFDYSDIFKTLLSWFPTNLLAPLLNSNAMQLIIMGILFGIGILKLDSAQHLTGCMTEVNNILLMLSSFFTKLIPFFVFITMSESLLKSNFFVLLSAGKSLAITASLQVLFALVIAMSISVKHKVKIGILIKKVSKMFLITLCSNSSGVSVPEQSESCIGKLGISPAVLSFGLPIGSSIFKPCTAIRYIVLALFMSHEYNISISAFWIIVTLFTSGFLSIAAPGIPGGVIFLCPMLFTQLGIPAEAINQLLATDIFFDTICTALNQVAVTFVLTRYAGANDMLDCDILRKPMKATA